MRNPAALGRLDANHGQIVGWYQELFCSVIDLHAIGGGVPDLLIGCSGRSELVEVKTDAGQLEDSQIEFHRCWRGSRITIVRTQADVVNHVANIRERVSRGGRF